MCLRFLRVTIKNLILNSVEFWAIMGTPYLIRILIKYGVPIIQNSCPQNSQNSQNSESMVSPEFRIGIGAPIKYGVPRIRMVSPELEFQNCVPRIQVYLFHTVL